MNKFTKIAALIAILVALFFQECPGQSCQNSNSNVNLPMQIKICYKELYKKSRFLIDNSLYALGRLETSYNINKNRPCPTNLNIKNALLKAMNLTSKNLTTPQSLQLNKDVLNELTNTLISNSAKVKGTRPIIKTVLKDSSSMATLLGVVLKKVQRHQGATGTTTALGMRKPIMSAAQLMTPKQLAKDIYCRVERLHAFALQMEIKYFNMSRSSV